MEFKYEVGDMVILKESVEYGDFDPDIHDIVLETMRSKIPCKVLNVLQNSRYPYSIEMINGYTEFFNVNELDPLSWKARIDNHN